MTKHKIQDDFHHTTLNSSPPTYLETHNHIYPIDFTTLPQPVSTQSHETQYTHKLHALFKHHVIPSHPPNTPAFLYK